MGLEIRNGSPFAIAPYEATHRVEVRKLCCDVAYGGRALEQWLAIDRELFADLFSRYYTDVEPQSAFVAHIDGHLVGYVFTCLDTKRYRQQWRTRVLVPALRKVLTGRYSVPIRSIPPLVSLALAYVRCGGLRVPWREFPGHLHVNTAVSVRGRTTLTRTLLHRAFDYFMANGVTRIHGVVMTSRARMTAKYERIGFQVRSECRAPRPPSHGSGNSYWLVLTMDLAARPHHPLDTIHLRTQPGTLAPDLYDR